MADSTNTYFEVLDAIKNYYGSGSDQWVEFAKYGITADNAEAILHQVPGVEIIKNADGSIRSYTYNAIETVSSSASTLNSNALSTQVKTKIPANMGVDSSTGNLTLKSGLATTGKFVMGSVLPAISATGIAITLGKTIDKALYETLPYIFDVDKSEIWALNPDTWGSITTDDDSLGATVFNTVLQINDDNTSQMYLDENVFAYMAYYMQNNKFFDESVSDVIYEKTKISYNLDYNIKSPIPIFKINEGFRAHHYRKSVYDYYSNYKITSREGDVYVFLEPALSVGGEYTEASVVFLSEKTFTNNWGSTVNHHTASSTNPDYYTALASSVFIINGTEPTDLTRYDYIQANTDDIIDVSNYSPIKDRITFLTDVPKILYGGGNIETISPVSGIGTQSGASTPDLSTATSIADTLALLKEQFPELWEKAVTQNIVQIDGSIKTYIYVPVATPDAISATDTQPTSGSSTQADPVVNPNTSPEILLDLIASISGSTPTPTDTNTESEIGKGSTPSLIVPVGSASALYKIYNPTQEQLNSFGAWLWSSDFVDQLLKLFNDPMQAIIGLHKVYTPVSVGGTSDIKVGYLSSGVTSNYISNQYVSVDCGSIDLKEFFNNIFDYDPYTDIHIYLPFIGIQKLNTGDVMRSSINVKYHVDVLTGACLAEINITRDGGGGILYTYSGNCAVQYPISSGSYMGIVASLASVTGGIVGTVATGGALAPMAIGAVSGLMNAHTSVSHSGGFSGNSGAMGVKIPYLIITRPQTELANTFPSINGYPTNYSVTLGQCSGYVEIENCHVSGIPATDAELSEIETLLKSGVIL